MKVGDLVKCWLPWGPDPRRAPLGVILDATDAPEDVEVYVVSSNKKYWLREGEFEVISEGR